MNPEVGQKYNRLTITKIVGRNKNSQIICECKCECGDVKNFSFAHVKIGHTKSCGCLKKDVMNKLRAEQIAKTGLLPFGQSAFNTFYLNYQRTSEKRKIRFNLSKEDFKKLIFQNCYYCGEQPNTKRKANHISKDYVLANGVDRVDNSKHYILSNCVSCCPFCNFAKKDMDSNKFLEKIKQICQKHNL
jgi:hypothetical protein